LSSRITGVSKALIGLTGGDIRIEISLSFRKFGGEAVLDDI
jgi:hypothetical protein